MKLEETKRHVVEVVVNCPLITDFSEYNGDKYSNSEALIKDVMANFDIVETGFLQGEDKDIKYALDLVAVEFVQGIEKVRGHRLLDIWKEACKKFKAHEIKSLARTIEKTIAKLNDTKVLTTMADKMKEMHTPSERFIHFMGTEHLTQAKVVFAPNEKRVDQEFSLIHEALLGLGKEEQSQSHEFFKAFIKSVIHRSDEQEKLCRDVLISPQMWEEFLKKDPRKRGMIIDDILDSAANMPKPQITTESAKEKEMENELNKYIEVIRAVYPDLAKKIDDMNSIMPTPLTEYQINDLLLSVVKNQLGGQKTEPKVQQNKITISGNPDHPMTQELAKMLNIDISEVIPPESEEDKRLAQIADIVGSLNLSFESLTGINAERLEKQFTQQENFSSENIVRGLDIPFLSDGKCNNPDCPVHGKKGPNEDRQRMFDFILSLGRGSEDRSSLVTPGLGKRREPGKGEFNVIGVNTLKVEEPKPTATEIETTSNVVINQKFIVNDVKGKFFCEYRMVWTPNGTRFMYSHEEPNPGKSRQFRHIGEFNRQMTQDEAFKEFQTLRSEALKESTRPKPYTREDKQHLVTITHADKVFQTCYDHARNKVYFDHEVNGKLQRFGAIDVVDLKHALRKMTAFNGAILAGKEIHDAYRCAIVAG